jgi:peptide/nickel transport system substrate-binding protein
MKAVTGHKKVVLLIGFVLLFFASCIASFAQTRGGHLVYGIQQDPDTLDAGRGGRDVVFAIAWNYLDPLVRTRPHDPKYYPGLAEKWTVSSDATVYTFHLRKDVKFHDGTPLTAEAVKFSIDSIMDPGTGAKAARYAVGPFERCEIVDSHTVKICFNRPYGSFFRMASTVYVPIVSPAAKKRHGDEYGFNVTGTGPFVLEEYVPGGHVTFVKNKDYRWGPEWTHGGPAFLDRVTYRFIPEDIIRVGSLRTGETNLIDGIRSDQIYRVVRDRKLKVGVSGAGGAPWMLILNTGEFPTDDRAVRQAISYAIDRDALVQKLYRGTNKAAYSPLEKSTPGYDPGIERLSVYDRKRAKAVLEKAGWVASSDKNHPDKKRPDENRLDGYRVKENKRLVVELGVPEEPHERQLELAKAISSQLKEVGIEIVIKTFDRKTAFQVPTAMDHNMTLCSSFWPDPQLLEHWFSPDPIGRLGRVRYTNPKLDDLLLEAERTADLEKRAEVYARVQDFLIIDAVCIPLIGKAYVLGMKKEIEGITYSISGHPVFYETFFSK